VKLGAHSYIWCDHWSDQSLPLLEHARSLGAETLEISVGDDVHFDPRRTGQAAADLGLELTIGPGGVWPMDCDISLPDAADRARGLQWHKGAVALAAEMGAVAYCGALYGHPGHVERRKPTDDEYRWIAENLHELGAFAAERGITVVLEPMSHFRTHLANRPEQIARLVDMADHPSIMALLDTYHLVTEVRDYAEAVREVGSRLWGIHACENDRGVPGGGLVPWEAFAGALREIGFDGYVCLETYNSGLNGFAASRGLFGDPCPDGDEFVRVGLGFVRRVLGG